jgi:hypothetical protein
MSPTLMSPFMRACAFATLSRFFRLYTQLNLPDINAHTLLPLHIDVTSGSLQY